MRKFGYMEKMFSDKTTRERSSKQESRIAKQLKGHTTINSGATFGENDIVTDYCEVEAKTTNKESFSLKLSDWRKLRKKCSTSKIPIMVVDFEESKDSLAVLTYDDLDMLIKMANTPKE